MKNGRMEIGNVGTILNRFEERGFRLIALKMLSVPREMAEKHYAVHQGKFFYEDLVKTIERHAGYDPTNRA